MNECVVDWPFGGRLMLRLLSVPFGLLLLTTSAVGEQWQVEDRAGDVYEIRLGVLR
jgi:hypothetical protein